MVGFGAISVTIFGMDVTDGRRTGPRSAEWTHGRMGDERRALRQARHDGPDSLTRLLAEEPWPTHCLQEIGDALLACPENTQEAAALCADRLRERGWVGDGELADQLVGAPAEGRPLPVDLDALADLIDGGMSARGGYLDLETGNVLPGEIVDDDFDGEFADVEDDRWMEVVPEGSREAYRDMVLFLDEIDDERLANRLSRALEGRGAFRRFRDELSKHDEPYTRWHRFRDDRRMGRARAWLAQQGVIAIPTR